MEIDLRPRRQVKQKKKKGVQNQNIHLQVRFDTTVFLNRCATAHLCSVSSFQVCPQFFCVDSYYSFDENKEILYKIWDRLINRNLRWRFETFYIFNLKYRLSFCKWDHSTPTTITCALNVFRIMSLLQKF